MREITRKLAAVCALSAGLFAGVRAYGEDPVGNFRLQITYDRPGLAVPHWELVVPPDGMAEYTGSTDKGLPGKAVQFPLSAAGRTRLGTLLARSKGLQPCETRTKNLANMGAKTVTYTPPSSPEVKCTFNYTDNKPLSDAMDYALAIVTTLQAGAELDRLHRFDRLGLDAVMGHLAEDARSGRAAELGAIEPTLQSLVTDDALMERVRTRAQQLMDLGRQQGSAAGGH